MEYGRWNMEYGRWKVSRRPNIKVGGVGIPTREASSGEYGNSKFGLRVSLDQALAMFEERWHENDQWYPDRKTYDEYKQLGKEAVKKMWGMWNARPPQVLTLERGFDWKLG